MIQERWRDDVHVRVLCGVYSTNNNYSFDFDLKKRSCGGGAAATWMRHCRYVRAALPLGPRGIAAKCLRHCR